MAKKHTVLVAEDEDDIRELLAELLSEYYNVIVASDGSDAILMAKEHQPSVIIMDILMPNMDGVLACDCIRSLEETKSIPIIMLTALNNSGDRIRSFKAGADDFLSKPFVPDELLARIQAKIRRIEERSSVLSAAAAEILTCGNLTINLASREVIVGGQSIDLTPREFKLIRFLVENKGRLRSRQEIMSAVWGDSASSDRVLDPHILSVRRKLSRFDHQIATVYGGGYILKEVPQNPGGIGSVT